MANDDISLAAVVHRKAVVANDDAGQDCLTLVLGHEGGIDPEIVPGGDQHLLKKGLHPIYLLLYLCAVMQPTVWKTLTFAFGRL
jgi:hypothetical protein